jgi:branched-chain amino acid transport system substrate-binding protein
VVNDGTDFGRGLGLEFRHAAASLGLAVGPVANADLVYYGGSPGGIVAAPPVAPGASVIGSDALLSPALLRSMTAISSRLYVTSPFIDPLLLQPQGQRFRRGYRQRFRRSPNPAAAYGYESMALLLDAIRRAGGDGDDRHAVIDEVLSTQDRHSVLGTYSIDGNGDTTLDSVSGYRISDGLPVFPVELKAPR